MRAQRRVMISVLGLGAAGLMALGAVPAAAASGHVTVIQHRSCSIGSTGYETNFGPPGQAAVWFNTESSPAGCEQYRVNITSQNLDCFSGGTPTNCRYTSGWIKNTGIQSAVDTCQASSGDCGPLLKAWEDRRPTGASSWSCRQIFPSLGSWRDGCTAD